MPNLTASIPHQLSRAEVKRRIQEQIALARTEHAAVLGAVRETWTGDTLDFSVGVLGQSVSGKVEITDQAVNVEIALPWLLAMLAGNVQQKIEQQGRKLLAAR